MNEFTKYPPENLGYDLGVYSEAVLLPTPEAPADHPGQGGGPVVEAGARGHQRPPTVPLTRVPAPGPHPGTHHVLSHVPGHRDNHYVAL